MQEISRPIGVITHYSSYPPAPETPSSCKENNTESQINQIQHNIDLT